MMCYYLNVNFQGQRVKLGVRKYRETDRPGDRLVYGGDKYLWVPGMEVAL